MAITKVSLFSFRGRKKFINGYKKDFLENYYKQIVGNKKTNFEKEAYENLFFITALCEPNLFIKYCDNARKYKAKFHTAMLKTISDLLKRENK